MNRLEEHLIRGWLGRPDMGTRILYHYTSAAGLLGILSSGFLRGTMASSLNDTSEIAFGHSVCRSVLEEQKVARSTEFERLLLTRTLGWMSDDSSPNEVYVTSFTEHRDVLSQWRGYGSGQGRFCIGFQLAQFSERDLLRFPQHVEYGSDEQRAVIRRAIAFACEVLLENPEDPYHSQSSASTLAMHLRRLMCSFKHPGFAQEAEWRSIATISEAHEKALLSFDVTGGVLRPHVVMLAGSRTSGRLPIVEVCIGNLERLSAAAAATRLLLSRYGYDDVSVTTTDVPFAG